VCGRYKNMLIIGGENYWATDIEESCHKDERIRPGCCAAFSAPLPGRDTEEGLVVVCELRSMESARADVARRVKALIAEDHHLPCYDLIFIKPRSILKTTSGKLRHREIKQSYIDGTMGFILYSSKLESLARRSPEKKSSSIPAVAPDEFTFKVLQTIQQVVLSRLLNDAYFAKGP